MQNNTTTETQPVYIGGRKVAVMRDGGMLCDIRRRNNGFLYAPHRVALSEALLESLGDTVTLQFTNMDSGDVWTTTVKDFRRNAEPIQYGPYEPQRAVELSRMNYTIQGKPKGKKRRNELQHIDVTPVPQYEQGSFFG